MKKYCLLIVLILIFSTSLFGAVAFAEETSATDFDSTFVLNDLNDAQILGETFDATNYKERFPQSDNGSVQLLAFVELGFSLDYSYQKAYGLYLYIYSPTGVEIEDNQSLNKVEIAVKYDSDGEPTEWQKFSLKLLSSDASHLIYKFKILDGEQCSVSDVYDRVGVSYSDRRYDINSVELFFSGGTNAKDYGIGGEWHISGFAKGLSEESTDESTLVSEATFSDTLNLEVQSTYYRTWQSAFQADQLSSVYFAVDNHIAEKYDRLYSVQAETWKYLTSPIFCVYDAYYIGLSAAIVDDGYDGLYSDLLSQVGQTMSSGNSGRVFYWGEFTNDETYTSLYGGYNTVSSNFKYDFTDSNAKNYGVTNKLAWIFQVTNSDSDSATNFSVSSDELQNWMSTYSSTYGKTVRGKYSSGLFADHYYFYQNDYASAYSYDGAANRYLPIDINADETMSLVGSSTKWNFWDALFNGSTYSSDETFSPLVTVSYADIKDMDDDDVSSTYLIASSDVADFRSYLKEHSDETVYLFRFDVSSYMTMSVLNNSGVVGYMSQEYVFLDFDIISLTYEKAGVKTVIPVVSDPIDIIAAIEPGTDAVVIDLDQTMVRFLTLLFTAVLIVGVVWLAVKFLRFTFKR